MMLLVWLSGWFLLLPPDFVDLAESMAWQSCLVGNIYFWRETGYFAGAAEQKPLLHCWSLSVEEQFYLLFPLAVAVLHRRRNGLAVILWLVSFVSFLASLYTYKKMPSASFYLLPTRGWELLMGVLLALYPGIERMSTVGRGWLSFAGLGLIAYPVFFYTTETPFPGLSAFWPCLGAALILSCRCRSSWVNRSLSMTPVRWFGLISYSLYLWHWPIISFLNYYSLDELTVPERLSAFALMICLGWLSYTFIEKRFRGAAMSGHSPWWLLIASVLGVFLIFGATRGTRGFPWRFPSDVLRIEETRKHTRFTRDLTVQEVRQGKFVEFGDVEGPGAPNFFVWGDSHSMAVLPYLDTVCKDLGIKGQAATHNSMPPILGASLAARFSGLAQSATQYNQAVFDHIIGNSITDVLLVGAWEDYFGREAFPGQLSRTVKLLQEKGKKVWILQEVPVHSGDVPHIQTIGLLRGIDVKNRFLKRSAYLEQTSRSRTALGLLHDSKVQVLDPLDQFYPAGQDDCVLEWNGALVYRDGGHLSTLGSHILGPTFDPLLAALKRWNSGGQ
jgi:peptidoglycan/LPS O-acetylase OafA/YrhL